MKITTPGTIRNFVVAGHNGCGKTSLCDLMLFKAGAVDRLGSVDAKTSVSDFTADEQDKRSSIYSAFMNCTWKDHRFFFTDTPGYGEFIGEMISSFRSCGFAVLVADGVEGIETGFSRAWKYSKEFLLPKIVFVNRLDREMADFDSVLSTLQENYGATVCVPVTIPVGREAGFSKVLNILTCADSDIPEDLKSVVAKYREQIMDAVAETDEALTERYLMGEKLTDEEVAALNIEKPAEVKLAFAVGDNVVIIGELFNGFTGTVQAISDDLKKVTVLVKRGSRDMAVELDVTDVKRAD